MIKEIIELFTQLKRPEVIKARDGEYIYDDSAKRYLKVELRPYNRTICNINSFADVVLEESRRRANPQGANMTVIFESEGGKFFSDDEMRQEQDIWTFSRKYTSLWKLISSIVDKKFTHKGLLDALESIRSSIPGYENLFQAISKLRASKRLSFSSHPIFADGEQSGHFEWEQKIDSTGSTEKACCPSEIPFKGKIVRGSEIEYEFRIQLTPQLDEEKGQIIFGISMPGFEMILDQVLEDEIQVFSVLVKPVSNLLILRNY